MDEYDAEAMTQEEYEAYMAQQHEEGYGYGDYDDYMSESYGSQDEMYGEATYSRMPLSQLYEACVKTTVTQTVALLAPLLGLCLVHLVTVMFVNLTMRKENNNDKRTEKSTEKASDDEDEDKNAVSQSNHGDDGTLLHLVSASCGLMALQIFVELNVLYILLLGALSYVTLYLVRNKYPGKCGAAVSFVTVLFTVSCELVIMKSKDWHKIRGAQMILAMKAISLAFDLDLGRVTVLPSLSQYAGYILHVGSVVFGPWFSYQDYLRSLNGNEKKVSIYLLGRSIFAGLMSLAAILYSSCLLSWLIMDQTSNKWLLAYRDAQAFRTSHYFVCFTSELTMILSGVSFSDRELSVSKPQHIEVPRSLVGVVTNWNLPMHFWLKTYVFKNSRRFGNFVAILTTYIASSLLHGLNFQLSAVLLSLGFYTYVDYVLRNRLAEIFEACIQARRCREGCDHVYKSRHPLVILTNLVFGGLAVFYLAFLGFMFDGSASEDTGYSMEHTLSKWRQFNYISHWCALGSYIFYLLI